MVNIEQEIDLQAHDEEPIRALHCKQFLWNNQNTVHCTRMEPISLEPIRTLQSNGNQSEHCTVNTFFWTNQNNAQLLEPFRTLHSTYLNQSEHSTVHI